MPGADTVFQTLQSLNHGGLGHRAADPQVPGCSEVFPGRHVHVEFFGQESLQAQGVLHAFDAREGDDPEGRDSGQY